MACFGVEKGVIWNYIHRQDAGFAKTPRTRARKSKPGGPPQPPADLYRGTKKNNL